MKVTFLLKASTAHTAADFQLKQVASTSGRLDVVSRCLTAALGQGYASFEEIRFCAVLEGPPKPPLCLEFTGTRLAEAPPTELEASALLFRILLDPEHPPAEGIRTTRESLENIVRRCKTKGVRVLYLHEEGNDIRDTSFPHGEHLLFVLGDHIGLDPTSERMLESLGVRKVNVGPASYLSSHCIIIVKDELYGRMGWPRTGAGKTSICG